MLSSRTLNVDNIESMKFNEQELLKSVEKAKEKLGELLKGIGNYIKWFCTDDGKEEGENDGASFLKSLEKLNDLEDPLSYLKGAKRLCSDGRYEPYRHTEFIVRYLHGDRQDPLFGISILDPCENCEKMYAKTTVENDKYNTVIISLHNYIKRCDSCKNNRKRKRSYVEEATTDNSATNFKCEDCKDRREITRPKKSTNGSFIQIRHDVTPYMEKYC